MTVKKLTLKDFREIDELPLIFVPKMNVIFGINGTGKSSLFDTIAIMLSWAINRIKSVGSLGKPITESDSWQTKHIIKQSEPIELIQFKKNANLPDTVIDLFLDETLSYDEMKAFINSHLQKDSSGKFGEFHTTIKYIFGDLAA